jgi:DNA repair exonuclease SbcCD ATPase subunit
MAALGQEKEPAHAHVAETKAEVPALTKFHAVIYQLWHQAWPNKDYDTLVKLLPEIEKHSAEVAAAELPGILHEKQNAWNENVKDLQQIVAEYKAAVEEKDNPKLLDAAERLHSQYEKLVRTIRPVLKEIADFHAVLYMLYHYYTPAYDLEKIRTSVNELQTKMDALNQATLPERLKKKEAAFIAARRKLATSVEALAATLSSNDEKKIKAAIETMHSDYEALQGVF